MSRPPGPYSEVRCSRCGKRRWPRQLDEQGWCRTCRIDAAFERAPIIPGRWQNINQISAAVGGIVTREAVRLMIDSALAKLRVSARHLDDD